MTRKDQHLNRERAQAVEHLIAASALSESDHFLSLYNPATHGIDLEGLNEWNWSGGEQVLVDLLLIICGYVRTVSLLDLWKLDEASRRAAITALDIAMNGAQLATVLVHPSLQVVK